MFPVSPGKSVKLSDSDDSYEAPSSSTSLPGEVIPPPVNLSLWRPNGTEFTATTTTTTSTDGTSQNVQEMSVKTDEEDEHCVSSSSLPITPPTPRVPPIWLRRLSSGVERNQVYEAVADNASIVSSTLNAAQSLSPTQAVNLQQNFLNQGNNLGASPIQTERELVSLEQEPPSSVQDLSKHSMLIELLKKKE